MTDGQFLRMKIVRTRVAAWSLRCNGALADVQGLGALAPEEAAGERLLIRGEYRYRREGLAREAGLLAAGGG